MVNKQIQVNGKDERADIKRVGSHRGDRCFLRTRGQPGMNPVSDVNKAAILLSAFSPIRLVIPQLVAEGGVISVLFNTTFLPLPIL